MDGHRFRMNFATVLRFMLEAKGSLLAKVRIKPDAESTSAAISDEGPGISAATLKGFHSGTRLTVGMMAMRERIKSLRGRFNIRSNRRWHETSGITHRLANS